MTADSPTSDSHARAHDPDPGCLICGGTGVRHQQRKNDRGFFVGRDVCPCTILGPLGQPELAAPQFPPRLCLDVCAREAAIFINDRGKPCALSFEEPIGYVVRDLSELPPIKDIAVLDAYPDCQPRTPIDPVARILSPGLMRGNADLPPATRGHLSELRDCTVCAGRGASRGVVCKGCNGAGRVKL